MNKSVGVIVVILVIVVLAIGGWYFVSNHSNTNSTPATSNSSGSNNMNNMHMSNSGSSNSSTSNQTTQTANAVAIQNFAFSPANISVKAGTTVTWTNKDSVVHTVTETDGQTGPSSGDINPNATYTFTFTKAGTYHYHCSIHTQMVGTVTVTS